MYDDEVDKMRRLKLVRQQIEAEMSHGPCVHCVHSFVFVLERIALKNGGVREEDESGDEVERESQF